MRQVSCHRREIGFYAEALKVSSPSVPTGLRPFRRWFRNWFTDKEGFRGRVHQLDKCQRGPLTHSETELNSMDCALGSPGKKLSENLRRIRTPQVRYPQHPPSGHKSWAIRRFMVGESRRWLPSQYNTCRHMGRFSWHFALGALLSVARMA